MSGQVLASNIIFTLKTLLFDKLASCLVLCHLLSRRFKRTPLVQLAKAQTEMGELFDATLKGDREDAMDAVGDVVVCLINYCALQDFNLVDCLELAYDQIKHRKGTLLPSGVFLKEA